MFTQTAMTLATFGLTLFARPLGAIILGRLADRLGRIAVMRLCMFMMMAGNVIMAVTPDYKSIGVAAPILLIIARLLHGFSLGGEFSTATALLVESVPGHETRIACWQPVSQISASLAATMVALVTYPLASSALPAGIDFRIAAALGAAGGLCGLFVRRSTLPAEPAISPLQAKALPRNIWHRILLAMGMISLASSVTYFGIFMPHFASHRLNISPLVTRFVGLATYGGQLLMIPLRYRLASYFDRTGRISPPLAACAVLFALPLPAMYVAQFYPKAILVMPLLFNLAGLPYFACLDGMLALLFPPAARGRGLAIGYSFGVILFGGMAPLTNGALIATTGSNYVPALYLMACSLVAIPALTLAQPKLLRTIPPKDYQSSL